MASNRTIVAFDLYGTLLSTESIAKELASHFGDDKAQSIAALWRRFQLEYTWRMNSIRNKSGRKTAIKPAIVEKTETSDADELAEFIDYLAAEIFESLPAELRTLTYSTWLNTPSLQGTYTNPPTPQTFTKSLNALCPTISESLTTYNLLPAHRTPQEFLLPVLTTYLTTILTPPPPPSLTRISATECEICERSWIPLTYHHLIPREVHAKVLKRGWHTEDQLQNVAWLCRACHSFVHRVASNEELAKDYFTVERLLEREDVVKFALWIGKVRWKAT